MCILHMRGAVFRIFAIFLPEGSVGHDTALVRTERTSCKGYPTFYRVYLAKTTFSSSCFASALFQDCSFIGL